MGCAAIDAWSVATLGLAMSRLGQRLRRCLALSMRAAPTPVDQRARWLTAAHGGAVLTVASDGQRIPSPEEFAPAKTET